MNTISAGIQQWLTAEWHVAAHKAGLREMNIVTSLNVQGQLAMKQYAQ